MIFHQPLNSRSNHNYNTALYKGNVFENHFHKNLEFIYVIEGAVNCEVNNSKYRLCKGDCGLCLPYDIHSYHPEENAHYWVMVFSEDFVSHFAKQITNKIGEGFSFNLDKDIELYIIAKLINNPHPTTLILKSCLYAICDEYQRDVKLTEKGNKLNETTAFIVDYIKANYKNQINLKTISKELGYDYNYTSRFFTKAFNMTFTEFVSVYRLESAINLLKNTEKSVICIAEESGFQSLRNFNRFFKEKMGISPTQYRKIK